MRLKGSLFEGFFDLTKIYGPLYTFWMGSHPWILIGDIECAKELFLDKRNQIEGRLDFKLC